MTAKSKNIAQAGSCSVTKQDPIKAAQEQFRRDFEVANEFLFDLRCGGEPDIMYDPVTGWELSMEGHARFYSLEGSESAVNMILRTLANHYKRLSAALGDPDKMCNDKALRQLHRDS